MGQDIFGTLFAALLLFGMYIMPAIFYGSLIALPCVLLFLLQKFSHQRFPNLSLLVVLLTVICSFLLVLHSITRSIIDLSYVLTIPSAPNAAEKQLVQSAAVDEATYRSLVPVFFQKPCISSELVCQLGLQYAINPWNSRDWISRMPVVSGLVAVITSLAISFWAQNMIRIRSLPDHEDIPAA